MPPPLRWGSMPRCRLGLQGANANCRGTRFQSTAGSRAQLRKTVPKQPVSGFCVAGSSGRRQCIPALLPGHGMSVDAGRNPHNCRAFSYSSSSSYSVKNDTKSKSGPGGQRQLQTIPKEDTNGRWYFQFRERIGKCIIFGLSESQLARAVDLVAAMSAEWEKLVLDMEEYPTDHDGLRNHTVPWGDMDSFRLEDIFCSHLGRYLPAQGHVNNVRYSRYAETSRVNWITGFARRDPSNAEEWRGLMTKQSIGLIMAEISIRFLSPVVYPDILNAYHKVIKLPDGPGEGDAATRSSMALGCVIMSKKQRRIVATVTEKVLFYDYRTEKKTDAPEFALKVLRRSCSDAAGAKAKAAVRIQQFREAVERLEAESWKRENAVEDLGSAAGGR
ncbi:uncharacterized protein PpBr36_11497 [Pyricularia pennisetigena]|uniref:uncharacterized protein n=1 Tax=Pyricularia pennisetigena TaxID=1578925 RepID=UPI001153FE86|nr:uncharacterized protein PpBr36_11497 [Pyricularia pennisetigena]TLS20220.1 hypothetical protein PpBr36_11497 [Pyricularia pennisetigena]